VTWWCCRFVWTKKIEREIQQGRSVKEFTARAEHEKHTERMVRMACICSRRIPSLLLMLRTGEGLLDPEKLAWNAENVATSAGVDVLLKLPC
jgi:hypothetical protein